MFYLPLAAAIRRGGIVEAFRGGTEAALYLEILDHHHYLMEPVERDPGADAVVRDYTTRFHPVKALWRVKKHPIALERRQFSGADRALYARVGDVLRRS